MPDFDRGQITEKGDVRGAIKTVDKKVDYLLAIMLGVVIVLFVGFITLLLMTIQTETDAYHDKQTDYQRLTDQIQAQNIAINELQKQPK